MFVENPITSMEIAVPTHPRKPVNASARENEPRNIPAYNAALLATVPPKNFIMSYYSDY
jgi:hypothetical protein